MKLILTILVSFLISVNAIGQTKPGYNIKGKIKGLKNTEVFLGNHYGDKQYLKDTATVDAQGNFTFEGNEKLDGGIYLIVLPAKNYFEIIVADQQHFSFETDTVNLISNFTTKNSKENQLFYDYLNFINPKGAQLASLKQEYTSLSETDEKKKESLTEKMKLLEKEVTDYKENIITQHPETFVAKIFKGMREVNVPEIPVLENGRPDSTFQYRYFKKHYFDNIDFSDDRVLRTPIYHNKLKFYMEQLTPQIPDSVIQSADYLINKARGHKELFKYTVWYITNTYEKSKIMGMDAVFYHMGKNYYCKGEAFWVDSATVTKICDDRIPKMEHNQIGKVAKNIVGKDTSGNLINLHSIQAPFTVVYFWDSDCGHCKKSTPIVLEEYHKWKDKGVKFVGMNVEQETGDWKKYVRENKLDWINMIDVEHRSFFRFYYDIYSTPVIYILDENKKIIVKRIGPEQISEVLENEFKKNETLE